MFVAIRNHHPSAAFFSTLKGPDISVGHDDDNYRKSSVSFFYQYLSNPLQAFKGSRDRKTYWVLVFEPLHSSMIYCFFFTSTTQIKYLLYVQIVLGSQV